MIESEPEEHNRPGTGHLESSINRPPRKLKLMLLLVMTIECLLQLGMVSASRFGSYYDDSIYVTAAKSLATGEGYRMISLPQPVAQILIPPFYPFLLSIIWRLNPHFPENLVWMMLLSVIATMWFLWQSWRYLITNRYATHWQALAVVTLTAINWRMMSLSTGIISEVLFAALSLAALHIAERYGDERTTWKTGALLGLLAGLVFLTRTSGLALLASITFYYLYRRQLKRAAIPVFITLVFVVGWFGWCYLNRSSVGGEHASYYAGYSSGIADTIGRLQRLNGDPWSIVYMKIIETNALGLLLVWAPLQSLGLRATIPTATLIPLILIAFSLVIFGFVREIRNGIRLLEVYCVIYLGLHLVVPGHSYERYVMPVVPLLLFFLVRELSVISSRLRAAVSSRYSVFTKAAASVIGLLLIGAAGLVSYSNATGIYHLLNDTRSRVASDQDKKTFDWIKSNTEPESVLICFGDLKYFLYTGRKTVRSISVNILDLTVYQQGEPDANQMANVFQNIVYQNHGDYLILNSSDFQDQAPAYGASVEDFVSGHPEQFALVFQSDDGGSRIYSIRRARKAQSG
jgi:hypothetical protein